MALGILATAALTLLAGLGFALAADRVRMYRRDAKKDSGTIFLFFAVLAAMLLTAGVREMVAWLALDAPEWQTVDRALFYLASILAAVAIVPMAQLVAHIAFGCRTACWVVTYLFSAIATLGVALLLAGGVSGPTVDAWGSDWHINSPYVIILIIIVAVLPGLWAMWLLARRASQMPGRDRQRIQCVAGACALYVSVLALGAAGVPGAWVLLERAAYLLAAWSAFQAYDTPSDVALYRAGVVSD